MSAVRFALAFALALAAACGPVRVPPPDEPAPVLGVCALTCREGVRVDRPGLESSPPRSIAEWSEDSGCRPFDDGCSEVRGVTCDECIGLAGDAGCPQIWRVDGVSEISDLPVEVVGACE